MKNKVKQVGRMCYGILFKSNGGWDKSPSLSIIFGLSIKTQWLSGLYSADFISFYSPTQLCGGGTTKSNSNELPISVPLSLLFQSSFTSFKELLGGNKRKTEMEEIIFLPSLFFVLEWLF